MSPVSIAMPYWNRPRELIRSVQAYAHLYPDMELEVSIADDGSAKGLEPHTVMDRWPKSVEGIVKVLQRKAVALNPCVPINVAIRQCKHDIIVLTNPEIEHRERVLDKMLESLTSENDYVMTGCQNVDNGAWYAGPLAPLAPIGGREPIPPGTHLHFCVMFHRALFERAGGFDEQYRHVQGCDDNDWLWKLYALGDVNFKYVPGTVYHHRTRHAWTGTPAQAAAILRSKWGHLEAFKCAS